MARKSRSKQRGKGAGTRSGSAGGKSQGGGRSSAGKGKSQGGSGKSGGGKSGGNKSGGNKSGGNKSGGNKRGSGQAGRGTVGGGQKSNPTKKTTTVSTKTTQTKSPTKTVNTKTKQPSTKKTLTPVQQRFKEREAKGLDGLTGMRKVTDAERKQGVTQLTQYRAAQKQQVQNAAKIRNDKFKAEQAAKAAAKKKAADEKQARQFDSSRLFSGLSTKDLFSNEAKLGGRLATSLADTFAKPKFMYQGNFAGRMPGYSNYFSPDVGSAAPYTRKGPLKGIPFAGADDAGSLTRFAVPKDAKIGRSVLGIRQYKLNPSQMKNLGMGVTDDVAKFAAKGLGKYGARAIPFAGAGLSLADSFNRFRQGDITGGALAAGSAIPGPVGWASLAGLAAKDISTAMNNRETQTASVDAGGLNIGSTDSGEASAKPSGVARVITGAADKVMRDTTDFDRRGKEKNFLADAFTQTNTALKTIKPYFDAAKGQDDKSIRKQASNLLTDIGAREELAPIARGIKAFTTDNPDVKDGFGRETIADIRDTFTPGKPKMPSIDPKSGIVMLIGNRMLAGDLKNIVKEADQQTGVEKGATRTLGQTINVARQIGKNLGDTSTQGYKSAQKIAKLTGTGSGKPTPGSLLRGVNPFSRSGRGGSTRSVPLSRAGGTSPNTLALLPQQQQQQTPAEQFTVPQIPQQQGLDAGNLANVQNQSYQNTFRNLMAINPNYSARFQMRPRRNVRRGNFRSMFSRDYF